MTCFLLEAPLQVFLVRIILLERSYRTGGMPDLDGLLFHVQYIHSVMQKTWETFGLEKISQLALENCIALGALIHWNHVNGIRFFR